MTYPAATVRRALGLLDEGMSSPEVGAELGVHESTVRDWHRRRLAGWEPQDKPCRGDVHGASHHAYAMGCRCPEARAAKREWQRGYYRSKVLRQPRLVPDTGTMRRIEGLMLLGWPHREIARAGGLPLETVKSLGRPGQRMVTPETEQAIKRAERVLVARGQGPSAHSRNRARRWGYAPLMAWDDDTIDDPDAQPDYGRHTFGYATRKLPDVDVLVAEVNRSGVKVVARRYGAQPTTVGQALSRAGYRAVMNGATRTNLPTYIKREAAA